MGSKRIKGITIEIDGNTQKLNKALQSSDNAINSANRSLRDTNRLLKLDPANTELLKQKQQYLTDAIDATNKKLDMEKKALEQAIDAGDSPEASEAQKILQREIIDTEKQLKKLEKEYKKFGSVAQAKTKEIGEKLKKTGSDISDFGNKVTKSVTVPIIAGVTATSKLASDYENAVAKVNTIANLQGKELEKLQNNILKVSNETGKSATEIAEATYQALSASVPTNFVTEFTKSAAILAKTGFTETATAVDTLTTIINAYGKSANEAGNISDKLIQIQNKGKTTVNELSSQLGNVIPTASALGVNFDNLGAAYIQLTKNGINTANATTNIRSMLNELSKSGSNVDKVLKQQTGKSFSELMNSGKSLGDVLAILNSSVNGNSTEFKNLWGNTKAGAGALAIVNSGTTEFNKSLSEMKNAAGNSETALNNLSTNSTKANKTLNQAKNTAIQLGQTLNELLGPILDKTSEIVDNVSKKVNNLSDSQKKTIGTVLLVIAAIGPILLIIGKVISAVGTIMSVVSALNPVVLIVIAVIAAVIAIGVLLYKNWDKIVEKLKNLKDAIKNFFDNIKTKITEKVGEIKTKVKETFTDLVDKAKTWAKDLIDNFTNGIKNGIKKVGEAVTGIADKVKSLIGFSEPDDGPLSRFHTFAPDMIDLWNQGIRENLPKIDTQMQILSDRVAGGMMSNNLLTSPINAPGTDITPITRLLTQGIAEIQKGGNVYIDGSKLVGFVNNRMGVLTL